MEKANANLRPTLDIAYIYQILHCNHLIILSIASAYGTIPISQFPSPFVVLITMCSGIAGTGEMCAVEDIVGKSCVSF